MIISSAGVVLGYDPNLIHQSPLLTGDSVAVGAAVYSLGRKLYTDKQLRLSRSGGVSHRNEV